MWLAKQRMSTGPVFGSVNAFEGLGIFFDTYDNERSHVRNCVQVFAYLNRSVSLWFLLSRRNIPSHMSKLCWATVISTMKMTRMAQQLNLPVVRYESDLWRVCKAPYFKIN